MSRFSDSSFLFALFFPNVNSEHAANLVADTSEAIILSPLVAYEFQQAVWLDVFRHEHGRREAISREQAYSGLAAYEINLERGVFGIVPTELEELLKAAIHPTIEYTLREGIRAMDLLHLAAARNLECSDFLTFDALQRRVAELEGFTVPV